VKRETGYLSDGGAVAGLSAERIDACADLVARGDPDRFAAVMAAPLAARGRLLVIYAFNLEVARAPWVTAEPMIAEMRLQWWRDVVAEAEAGRPARAHEVAAPLAGLIGAAGLPVEVMDRLILARRWDVYRDAFADEAALEAYLEETGAGLMWLAGRALGAGAEDEAALRAFGWAAALAGYLRAVPELEARGRIPLLDGRPEAVAALARAGVGTRCGGACGPAPIAQGGAARHAGRVAGGALVAACGGRACQGGGGTGATVGICTAIRVVAGQPAGWRFLTVI
jgi:15-cis-phytoene synthase